MATYSYDSSEPASNSNPSDSQPIMLTNAASISSIIAVDHVGFNTANGGFHKQVSFNGNNSAGAQTGNLSTIFTEAGTASGEPVAKIKNSKGTFPMSLLKAAGSFADSSGTSSFYFQCKLR